MCLFLHHVTPLQKAVSGLTGVGRICNPIVLVRPRTFHRPLAPTMAVSECGFGYIKPSSTSGNGVFASQDLSPGRVIIEKLRPLVAVLDQPRVLDTCSNCFVFEPGVTTNSSAVVNSIHTLACSGCKTLRYCSQVCSVIIVNIA